MVITAKGQSSLEEPLSECRGITAETEDPLYGCQWHLKNTGQLSISGNRITAGEDINVEGVWNEDVYGSGINVAIVSDGIDLSHEDLSANVRSGLNYNLFEKNSSEKDNSDSSSFSGTRAAGVTAATGYNGLGVRGTAPGASIYSNELTDDLSEADAMVRNKEITAVSVNDWGYEEGVLFQGALAAWEEGVELGIREGFYGKGVFYVWGAGNGHERGDQANFSEYSSYYGVTAVCSTDGFGKKSLFSEEGVNLWVCAPGSDITTTDNNNNYVVTSGTVLSASQVGGVAALLREINGELSWRDIKLILAGSARQNDFFDMSWETGAVKYGSDTERYNYNPKYGFGVVDAEAAAELARSWKSVGEMKTVTASSDNEITIPDGEGEADGVLVSRLMIPDLEEVTFTEFTEVELVFSCDCLQDLNINITSPSGTVSELVRESVSGSSDEEKNCVSYLRRTHRFGSANHLGEDPSGEWVLNISDTASGDEENTVTLHSWSIKVYGHKKGDTVQDFGREITTKALTFGGATVPDQNYRVGIQVNEKLPVATGGDGTLTYSITPALPTGLSFNTATRMISGTPTTAISKNTYTYTVEDVDGDTAELMFRITILADAMPIFSSDMIDDQEYVMGTAVTETLPEATEGNGAFPDREPQTARQTTYNFPLDLGENNNKTWGVWTDGAILYATAEAYNLLNGHRLRDRDIPVPVGFTRFKSPWSDGTTLWVANKSAGVLMAWNLSTKERDPDKDIDVNFVATFRDREYFLSRTASITGHGNLIWVLMENEQNTIIPVAYAFNKTTKQRAPSDDVNVLPLGSDRYDLHSRTYIYTDGTHMYVIFPYSLQTGNQSISGFRETMGLSRTHLTTGVAETINTEIYHYESPIGITTEGFDGWGDYVIVNVFAGNHNFRNKIRAFNKNTGAEVTTEVIDQALFPSFGGVTVDDRIFTVGETTGNIVLPYALSGNPPITYSLTPALPTGLDFNASTRVISGTPTTATSKTTYTYTVTDDDGDTDEITFNITVVDSTVPTFRTRTIAQTIANQEYIAGSQITPVTLPVATGGNTPLTYSLIPDLPTGLNFTPATRVINGTPTTATSKTMYTYTVTDDDGDTAELTFEITVEADAMPTFSGEMINDRKYVTGTRVIPERLPVATGGNGALRYSLAPALPAGLSFNAITRVIRGRLLPGASQTTYTYTVTDDDGDTAELTFEITVETNSIPNFGSETIDDKEYIAGSLITPVTMPAATGGNTPLTYSLIPDLPTGLNFDSNTQVISGTPTTAMSKNTYTYTVEDIDGNTAKLMFGITILADSMPDFSSETIDDQEYIAGSPITPVTLPVATGGNGGLTYSLTPDLPAGLDFNEVTRVISGTPTTAMSKNTYTYTVEDVDGDTAKLMFGITVLADSMPDFGSETIDDQEYVTGTAVTVTLPVATGGNAPLTYSLTPDLPAGLDFDSNTQVISGTPTTAMSKNTYTYKVEDVDGDTAKLMFGITILADSMPDFGSETIDDKEYIAGSSITPVTLPVATGGNTPVTYSITPDLPVGLNFTPATRVISGTPTTAMSKNTYTYTVEDIDGDIAKLMFGITILADSMPDFGSETIDDQEYIAGSSITPVTLPVATGGNTPVTYSITPDLPVGLNFTPATRVISGTPTTAMSKNTYTYTVEDIDGDTAELTFSITIEEDSTPDLDDTTISTQMVYTAGSSITLPAATGGNPPVTYSIAPDLPAGLSFNSNTQTISGTPTSASTDTYTYTVKDRNGDKDEVRFILSVEAPPAPPRPTPPRRPTTLSTDSGGGGGGCAISDQNNVVSDLLGVMACLMLIPVSVMIKRKRRSQIKK